PFPIHRPCPHHLVDAPEDVAEIAVAEVLDIGSRESLAPTKAAARIGHQDEVAPARQRRGERGPAQPSRREGARWAAVDEDDQGIAASGIEVAGGEEPALDVEPIALPLHARRLAPLPPRGLIGARDGPPLTRLPGPDLRRPAEGVADHRQGPLIA